MSGQRRFAFILRLWTEPSAVEAAPRFSLRGSLQLVDTDERIRYFDSFAEIPQILREVTGWQETSDSIPAEGDDDT